MAKSFVFNHHSAQPIEALEKLITPLTATPSSYGAAVQQVRQVNLASADVRPVDLANVSRFASFLPTN